MKIHKGSVWFMAKKQFKAESKRLLDLMINSIYTHKEIFLREIISNASDALEKARFLQNKRESVRDADLPLEIRITADKEADMLIVTDTGVGMTEQEMIDNLGTIAKSGSEQFLRERDILPNLKWLPSTSIHPGADHRPFWNTIRPIDDTFWNIHRPGDRWNCKCDLTATDEEPTPLPDEDDKNKPQPGLDNNPGTDGKLFSDKGAQKAVDKLMARIDEMIAEMPDYLTGEEKMAIARNNLEMEKALKIKKGKPMDVDKADKQNANPKHVEEYILDSKGIYRDKRGNRYRKNSDYDKKRDTPYSINCQTCAPAYALRLRGWDITAKGNVAGSKLEYLSNGRAFEVWKNTDGTPAQHISINSWLAHKGYLKMTPKRYMEYFNEVCKEEGVYELCIGWKSGGGHATILQRFADGELRYIEPQSDNSAGSGMEWKDVKYLCEIGAATSHNCRGVLRIDNKLFDVSFLDIFDT